MAMAEHVVTTLAQLPAGSATAHTVDGVDVAVFHTESGALHAMSAYCTHANGPMAGGHVQDGVVLCPLHLMAFDLITGESHHFQPPMAVYPVRLDDQGQILIEL